MFKLAALLMLPALHMAANLQYTDCGSHANIQSIQLSPSVVDAQGNNVFYFEHTYRATVHFSPTENFESTNLKNLASGIIAGTKLPFEILGDPCSDGDVQCPIHVGHPLVYHATIKVPTNLTELRLAAKWQLNDPDTNRDVLCFVFPAITRQPVY